MKNEKLTEEILREIDDNKISDERVYDVIHIKKAIEKTIAEKDKEIEERDIAFKDNDENLNGIIRGKYRDILMARKCLNFKLIKCNNKDCKNQSCPLNRRYDE